jgi:hypothetical protein
LPWIMSSAYHICSSSVVADLVIKKAKSRCTLFYFFLLAY